MQLSRLEPRTSGVRGLCALLATIDEDLKWGWRELITNLFLQLFKTSVKDIRTNFKFFGTHDRHLSSSLRLAW